MSRPHGSDVGESLVEILISITIVGIAFAAILGGLAASSKGSGQHEDQAVVGGLLRNAAEAVQDPAINPWPASGCPSSFSLGTTIPAGTHSSTVTVSFWDPVQGSFVASPPANCQLVRATVKVADVRVGYAETVDVTRRRP